MPGKRSLKYLILFVALLAVAMIYRIEGNSGSRMHGVSLVSPPDEVPLEKVEEVKRVNADWVAVIPYAFSRSTEAKVVFDNERQWWGERTDGVIQLISYAHSLGLKVMLKPHVWVSGQGWTGEYNLGEDESAWKRWEESYSDYILHFAAIADSMEVELLCIGTEYRIAARQRPDFWRSLLQEVRSMYTGKVTYAANWDNFEQIEWWDAVDFIGIDAYFPITQEKNPSMEHIQRGWLPLVDKLERFSEGWSRPVLFTEYGFQSAVGAAGNHWEVEHKQEFVDLELQANAYEATFRVLENEDWYVGGFFWKWHLTSSKWGKRRMTNWTPQDKPAEQVIARWYAKNR